MNDYGISIWGDNNFIIKNSKLKIDYKSSPNIIKIVKSIRKKKIYGPLLLRFPHLIEKQIDLIYSLFKKSFKEMNYKGDFKAVFPLKVNHYPSFLKHLIKFGKKYNYGLEAGSKAELMLAMSLNTPPAPITVNGFKDKNMIHLCFLASKLQHDVTIIIEGISELQSIIEIAKNSKTIPNIGIRIRLHNSGEGTWAKSGGINSKFGLNATEIIQAMKFLKSHNLMAKFTMIHFHIGSLLNQIAPLKKALKEAGNIYGELIKMGAENLNSINIGGGLSIEHSQHKNLNQNYTTTEYVNDVVFMLKEIALAKNVKEPTIFIESGRFISAPHGILVTPVLELLSSEFKKSYLQLKAQNPPLIMELHSLYLDINSRNALEYLHDAIDHFESILTLFDLGYVDLIDRSNSEILFNLIFKKASLFVNNLHKRELKKIKNMLEERYLLNFSLFQSLPDYWGLGQKFPVMPLHKLNISANRSATLWDISCDSDGEIAFDKNAPLFLHDVDLNNEEYFLGFFLVGAYQDILGMNHNMFAKPTQAIIKIDKKGFKVKNIKKSPKVMKILNDLDYSKKEILNKLYSKIDNSKFPNLKKELNKFLSDSNYLKTTSK